MQNVKLCINADRQQDDKAKELETTQTSAKADSADTRNVWHLVKKQALACNFYICCLPAGLQTVMNEFS